MEATNQTLNLNGNPAEEIHTVDGVAAAITKDGMPPIENSASGIKANAE
jgi:hypothetical protein